jgi:tRNA nucleotidyltransferase (CCA-adding enzyme)
MAIIGHEQLQAFAERSVNLSSDDAKRGRERVQHLRDRLERYIAANPGFDLVKMLHAGSVAKGTALATLNDMDVAVYVRRGDESDSVLVGWLVDRLREAYEGVLEPDQIQPGTHCATVSFKSEGGLDVDVVPVLYEDDPDDRGFLIAKDTGDRLLTSVPLHLEFIRARKSANADFAQVVRFLKWWSRNKKIVDSEFKLKSFMLELITASQADAGLDLFSYPEALREMFAYIVRSGLEERIAFSDYYSKSELPVPTGTPIEIFDPVNPENNVAFRYTAADRERIVDAADEALSAILEAGRAPTKERAVARWQLVLGSSFRA